MLQIKQIAIAVATLVGLVASEPQAAFFDAPIDHKNLSMGTYRMQYLVDEQYLYNTSDNGELKPQPILFYAGNEGAINDFYQNSGFMTTTLAEKYGALVVFAEHRYFGLSFPFPKDVAYTSPYNSYLTVEQTLADYVDLLNFLKMKYNMQDKATIAFGGSYGGMLAAWMRMKYPHVIQGSLAASAPVLLFKGANKIDLAGGFGKIASDNFNVTGLANDTCYLGMKDAFKRIITKKNDTTFIGNVADSFKTCDRVESEANVTALTDLIRNGFFYMAMTDYPYDSSFLEPMPGYPINVSCQAFASWNESATDAQVMVMLDKAAQVYFNWTNSSDFCYDIKDTSGTGTLAAGGWDCLACNQLAMPQGNGLANSSIFVVEDDIFNETAYTAGCQAKYNLTPDYDWALKTFGGKQDYTKEYRQYSNIIFSNGNLDPWLAGGVSEYVGPNIPTILIKGGAHHLDLRLPNDEDPELVTWARDQEARIIEGWIRAYQGEEKTLLTKNGGSNTFIQN